MTSKNVTDQFAREVELRLQHYAAQVHVDERMTETLTRASLDSFKDHVTRAIVLTLRREIFGITHPVRHVVRYPLDWWQALKERFAPAWFRDRYPVIFVEISCTLEELYPDIAPSLPGHQPFMKFQVYERTESPIW
jgi:hypothetical protein